MKPAVDREGSGSHGLSERTARRLAWSAFVLCLLFFVTRVVLELATPGRDELVFNLTIASFPVAALVILTRQPRNRIGWILMIIALLWGEPLAAYGQFAVNMGLPGGAVTLALDNPLWAPPVGLMGTVLLLRFPDGKLFSPGWRHVERLAAAAIALSMLIILFGPENLADMGHPELENPFAIDPLRPLLGVSVPVLLLIPITILASVASLVIRFRRSTGTERLQMKWLTTAAAGVAVLFLVTMIATSGTAWFGQDAPTWVLVLQEAASASFVLFPVSITFAVLKHRLYDIDVFLNKSLVYGAMAVFITLVYVAIVVGVGGVIGSQGSIGLSILTTALVAVAFQPVRERVQRFANRVVYGQRATPYEVLSEFAGGMSHAVATEEVLPQMARIVAQGTGASRADVWLRVGSHVVREATWPESDDASKLTIPLAGAEATTVGDSDRTVPVRHQGEVLGLIGVKKARGEALSEADGKLLRDLASQASVVLRNVRLIEELRASRTRIVAAQDEERRRLERDIHDGAQQQLVAMAMKLRLAQGLVAKDPDKAGGLLEQLRSENQETLETLRDLARGIYPPLLRDAGLPAALEAQARKGTIPVEVHSDGVGRFPQAIEAAAYFCVLEALQNISKYAGASAASVRLRLEGDDVVFSVTDDGRGFDPASTPRGSGLQNMADRLESLGGKVQVASSPGAGTTVTGRIPVAGASA